MTKEEKKKILLWKRKFLLLISCETCLEKKWASNYFFFACLVSVLWSLICGFLKIFNENSKVVEKSRRWWEKRLKTVCVQNHYIVQKIRNKKWKAKLASFSSWSYPHNMPFLSEKKRLSLFWKQRIRAQKVFGFELFAMHQNERINDHPNDACMVILKLFDANITSKCIVKYSACIWWEKKSTICGIFTNPVCNTFSKWCQKCDKMMDIDASRKCWILVQKGSKCLNSLSELIYFLVTVSILCFRKMLSQNLTWKNSVHAQFMLPQNFGTNFEIQQKVLTRCWIALVTARGKVFLSFWMWYINCM